MTSDENVIKPRFLYWYKLPDWLCLSDCYLQSTGNRKCFQRWHLCEITGI